MRKNGALTGKENDMNENMTFKTSPSQKRQDHLEIVQVLLDIIQIALQAYKKNPTEQLGKYLKEQQEFVASYRKKHNL